MMKVKDRNPLVDQMARNISQKDTASIKSVHKPLLLNITIYIYLIKSYYAFYVFKIDHNFVASYL